MKQFTAFARRHLPIVHFVADSVLWAIAIPIGVFLRYDFAIERVSRSEVFLAVGVAVVLQGVLGLLTGLYRRRWRYGSFDEARVVAMTALMVGVILTAFWWQSSAEASRPIPRSVPMLATGVSVLGHLAIRSTWRLYVESRRRPAGDHLMRIVVVGAGEGAHHVLRTLNSSTDSPYLPVAMVDDDRSKRNLSMSGVRVAGTVDDLGEVAEHHDADTVLIAAPSAPTSFYRRVHGLAQGAGLKVLVLPAVDQLLDHDVGVSDIRPVNESDLLGRRPADIDPTAVAGYITGRRVLVTGAGGSIGSEICRQLACYEPAALVMLDRDESGLHGTQLSIEGRAMLDNPNLVLADIRDRARIDEVFAEHRPEVVFHAAALKHLPLLEMHPGEGWKTNVCGTLTLLDAARRHGVGRFVNVSTDKAANPTSVLGWTKRITERLTAHASMHGPTECVSVRFGNVLGSSGSVLKAFEAQADRGGPITVTDPEITRYFMTIVEASRLTIYAGAIGDPGEVMILDMGEPVKIVEVAERFANQHDPPLEIVFTGLRPNEKLHEDLFSVSELGERRIHEMITHVSVRPLEPTVLMSSEGPTPTSDEMREIAQFDPPNSPGLDSPGLDSPDGDPLDEAWSALSAATARPETFEV